MSEDKSREETIDALWFVKHWAGLAGIAGLSAYLIVWGGAEAFYSQLDLQPAEVGLGYGELLQRATGLVVIWLIGVVGLVVVLAIALAVFAVGLLIGNGKRSLVWVGGIGCILLLLLGLVLLLLVPVSIAGRFLHWPLPSISSLWSGRYSSLIYYIWFLAAFFLLGLIFGGLGHDLGQDFLAVPEEAKDEAGLKQLLRRPLVRDLFVAIFVLFPIATVAVYLPSAYFGGMAVRDGRPVKGGIFVARILFPAEHANVYGVALDPAIQQGCLLYLGQANNTAVLWESKNHRVVRLQTGSATLVLGGTQSQCSHSIAPKHNQPSPPVDHPTKPPEHTSNDNRPHPDSHVVRHRPEEDSSDD